MLYEVITNFFISVGSPIGDFSSSNALCFLIIKINPVFDDMLKVMGMGQSVEVVLAQKRETIALFLSPTRFDAKAALNTSISLDAKNGKAIHRITSYNVCYTKLLRNPELYKTSSMARFRPPSGVE